MRPARKTLLPKKKPARKPQGPLVIVVSIDRQKVTVYDTKGVFAESPVSTGMKGHSTPMGVFSVIQKHKFHHSNIYSGAPMPYMQRITWSGVAMHAGVLPGYPASHGCIRMPMAFAVKMWNWTRMGARVIVSPGQMSPQNFSHPLLASLRVPPQPAASLEPQTNAGDKADKGAANTAAAEAKPVETKTASADGVLELRSSVGHTVMSDVTTGYAAGPRGGRGIGRQDRDNGKARDQAPLRRRTRPSQQAGDAAAKPREARRSPKPAEAPNRRRRSPNPRRRPMHRPAAPAQAATPDVKKDETRVADPAPVAKPEAPKRAGQIAVFISRKDSKLYVRQNFAPLFEVPVTIAASDRPLGTHVFTAEIDKADSNALHWSVVSLPVSRPLCRARR